MNEIKILHFENLLTPSVHWDPNARNYGFIAETEGLRRSASDIMDDCKDFLHLLATFLPHGYLTEKLVSTATSFAKAFDIIQEHYGLMPTQESFLDLDSFSKQTGESYRQFYERIQAHARQHLHATPGVAVETATVPDGGDRITVSHANLLALIWLKKIHPKLVNIVRTEYSLELRDNKPLAGLVPRIAVNVDNLLSKYDKVGAINVLNADDPAEVKKTFVRRETGNREAQSPFCPGCFTLHKNSKLQVHFKHLPSQCPRKAAVKFIDMEEFTEFTENIDELDLSHDCGNYDDIENDSLNSHDIAQEHWLNSSGYEPYSCFNISTTPDVSNLDIVLANIQSRITTFRKEQSPTLCCSINDFTVTCIIDEGSVINCCSYAFAKKAGLPIDPVSCKAVGANKSPMKIAGVTRFNITAHVKGARSPCLINISRMIVIYDLGTDILL